MDLQDLVFEAWGISDDPFRGQKVELGLQRGHEELHVWFPTCSSEYSERNLQRGPSGSQTSELSVGQLDSQKRERERDATWPKVLSARGAGIRVVMITGDYLKAKGR